MLLRMTELTPAQLLREAVEVLHTGGWQRWASGPMRDPTEPHCVVGAVYCASAMRLNYLTGWSIDPSAHSAEVLRQAVDYLQSELPADLGRRLVVQFNDHPSTTVEDVHLLFKRAIAAAEAQV